MLYSKYFNNALAQKIIAIVQTQRQLDVSPWQRNQKARTH